MISDRFKNLRNEKKEKIFLGIKKVLRKKPYEDIITTDLIEGTEISRGSFYSYFTDKRDAVQALCIDESVKIADMFKQLVLDKQGDYFEAVKAIYEELKNDVNLIYAGKVIANFSFINDILIEILNKSFTIPFFQEFNKWCLENAFKKFYKMDISIDEVGHINMLCIQIVSNALTQVLRSKKANFAIEKVDKGFETELNIIKNGVLKNE